MGCRFGASAFGWTTRLALLSALWGCTEEPVVTNPPDDPDATADADVSGLETTDADTAATPDVPIDVPPTECTDDSACASLPAADCRVYTCDTAAKKCVLGNAADGSACKTGDGKACTQDVCQAGQCVSTEGGCPGLDENGKPSVCWIGQCHEDGKGGCESVKAAQGQKIPCDDGNACTAGEICSFGKCANGAGITCPDDEDFCTEKACDAATGCGQKVTDEGVACNDGDACTAEEKCGKPDGTKPGQCVGIQVVCKDDGNPCTQEACDKVAGCEFLPVKHGDKCSSTNKCEDPATTVCQQGKCSGLKIKSADDGNPCTKDVCDPVTGKTEFIALSTGACSDGEPCTKNDTCAAGQCKASALICNDGNPCTTDLCDPKLCPAGGECGQCATINLAGGATCTDNDACTTQDTCKPDVSGKAKCTGLPHTTSGQCDDKNPCTTDSCQPGPGCIHTAANGGFCDDGNACTTLDKCKDKACAGTTKDCSDNNPCTNDNCDAKTGKCASVAFVGKCNDNDSCTTNDVCEGGTCDGTIVTCNDGNPCTNDICDTKIGCTYQKVAGGSPCDDGLSCTSNEVCDGGQCKPVLEKDYNCTLCDSDLPCKALDGADFLCSGQHKCVTTAKGKVCSIDKKSVVKCDASGDTECAKNTCSPDNGQCKPVLKKEGTFCAVGNKCIENGGCTTDGKCKGIDLVCNDDNPCTQDACDPKTGCTFKPLADKALCDDANPCTIDDACTKGKCGSTNNQCKCNNDTACAEYDDGNLCNGLFKCLPAVDATGKPLLNQDGNPYKVCEEAPQSEVVCAPLKGEPCKANLCDAKVGKCTPTAKPDGGICNDNNACTLGDTCTGGACKSVKPANCDDSNLCTLDVCDSVFGCANAPMSQGALCVDGDDCTEKDTCKDGVCAGKKLSCDDGNACTVDLCNKKGGCVQIVDNNATCDDGDPCSGKDLCQDGKCAGPPIKCNDDNPCTVDACDGKGGCKNVLVEGSDCTDGDGCTTGDTCLSGKCNGKKKNCDDGNACTEDGCTGGSCLISPSVGKVCDDGNACTLEDQCDLKGACTGSELKCDTGNKCITVLQCSPVKGCITAPNDGISCSDGDACTTNDTCQGGGCTGKLFACDDKNICTNDTCDKVKGCLIAQNTCDDKNDCTIDTCDKVKGCQYEVVEGSACDDGDKCTDKGQCKGGKCESKPVVCDDKNTCTIDSCDSKTGCVLLPGVGTEVSCDDKDPCTEDGCSPEGKCVGVKKVCDDGNPCTLDECNPVSGCVVSDAKEGTACDDQDSCTCTDGVDGVKNCVIDKKAKPSVCQSGICSGGTMLCGLCGTDKDCSIFDNNNLCDGAFTCKTSKANGTLKVCYLNPDPVSCDSTQNTPCQKNLCNVLSGKCEPTQSINGSSCQDGLGCTSGDVCNNGKCQPGQPTDCSKVEDTCNTSKCVENALSKTGYDCVGLPKENSSTCDADKNGCTANDFCFSGKCQAGAKVDCTGVAKECQIAECASLGAAKFECAISAAPEDAPCNDGQLCTAGDLCKSGKCQAGTKPYDCAGSTTTCADGFCDKAANGGAGGCIPKPKNEGKACDADDTGCTVNDKCVNGFCVPGAPPDCADKSTSCTTGACKSISFADFQCIGAPKADKLPCEADNNGCTVGDACKAGSCAAGVLKDCSSMTSKDGCQVGTCKSLGASAATCTTTPAQTGSTCNADDNGCTKGDACNKDGACVPGNAVDCLAFTGACAQGECKSTGTSTFQCDGLPKKDGIACDADGTGCTVGDTCKAGKCVPGAQADCSAKAATCLGAKCIGAGSDKYQCDAIPLKDGTSCDSDQDGCTVDDSCQLGFCAKGDLQTCSSLAGLCGDVACKSTGSNAHKCEVAPKESYPPLDPPEACTPTDKPVKCKAGYDCAVVSKDDNLGTCLPKVTVFCDDKNPCTEADACTGGKCVAGKAKDCDDKDPCTLDSCGATGKCDNVVIKGCVPCVNEAFDDPVPKDWVATTSYGTLAKWVVSEKNPFAGVSGLRATWVGPPSDPTVTVVESTMRYRRLYIEKGLPSQIDFHLSMNVATQTCGKDDVSIVINGNKIWEKCDNTQKADMLPGSTFEHIAIDLAKYAGAPVDLEIRVEADMVAQQAAGTVDIDNVRVTGACGPGCLGAHFEGEISESNPNPPVNGLIPEVWSVKSTNTSYVGWKWNDKLGHTGKGSMRAAYAGSVAKSETATVTIPRVRPEAKDKLWFAVRAPKAADANCGADDLIVKIQTYDAKFKPVALKEVYKRCNPLANWQTEVVDLAPYASQTVDIQISVVTGAGSTTAGEFELDDIAVAGNCTYACFFENFDTTGVTPWAKVSTEVAKFKLWTASNVLSNSPDYSAYVFHDNTVTEAKISKLTSNGFFQLPIMGATWSFWANLYVQTAKCPESVFSFRAITQQTSANVVADLQGDKDKNKTLQTACDKTDGWQQYTGEMPSDMYLQSMRLAFYAIKGKSNPQAKFHVDDVVVMCK